MLVNQYYRADIETFPYSIPLFTHAKHEHVLLLVPEAKLFHSNIVFPPPLEETFFRLVPLERNSVGG